MLQPWIQLSVAVENHEKVGLGLTLERPSFVWWIGTTGSYTEISRFDLSQAVTYPSMAAMLAQWSPPSERSKMSTFVYAGIITQSVIFIVAQITETAIQIPLNANGRKIAGTRYTRPEYTPVQTIPLGHIIPIHKKLCLINIHAL